MHSQRWDTYLNAEKYIVDNEKRDKPRIKSRDTERGGDAVFRAFRLICCSV